MNTTIKFRMNVTASTFAIFYARALGFSTVDAGAESLKICKMVAKVGRNYALTCDAAAAEVALVELRKCIGEKRYTSEILSVG